MVDLWIISDTHFGHANIIKYCDRPFKSAELMDETILANWNDTVRDNDIIYHLGDVYFRNPQILYALKGRKHLLLGNHDNGRCQHLQATFRKIGIWRKFPPLLLSHIPVHPGTLETNQCQFNVHGHTHNRNLQDQHYINVSVEQTGYKPIHIDEVIAIAAARRVQLGK